MKEQLVKMREELFNAINVLSKDKNISHEVLADLIAARQNMDKALEKM